MKIGHVVGKRGCERGGKGKGCRGVGQEWGEEEENGKRETVVSE